MNKVEPEARIPAKLLCDGFNNFTKLQKMRLDMNHPADGPSGTVLSGHLLRLRMQKSAQDMPDIGSREDETPLAGHGAVFSGWYSVS